MAKNIAEKDRQLAAHLADLRRASGMTQQQLANKAGMSITGYCNIETGRALIRGSKIETISAIADALNVTVDKILNP